MRHYPSAEPLTVRRVAEQLPVALQPVLDEFAAAWNDTDDEKLRQLIAASPRDNAWDEFDADLQKRGWQTHRPSLAPPTSVRNWVTSARVEYSLGSATLKTHWEVHDDRWRLDYLYIWP